MPLFMMIGRDAPGALEKRKDVRPRHLAHLEPLKTAGKVLIAGPVMTDDGASPCGSLVVFEADDLAAAKALAARDPYVVEGVFGEHEVKPFTQVIPEAGS